MQTSFESSKDLLIKLSELDAQIKKEKKRQRQRDYRQRVKSDPIKAQKRKEQNAKDSANYRARHKDKFGVTVYEEYAEKRQTDIPTFIKHTINSARGRHNRRVKGGRVMEFNIDNQYIEELLVKSNMICAQTGVQMDLIINSPNLASLDRIDSNLGYVKGNCQFTTVTYNRAKMDSCDKDFTDMVVGIVKKNLKEWIEQGQISLAELGVYVA